MKVIDKGLDWIEKICCVIASILLMWMLFALSVQVIARFVFNTGFAWTEESARYAMVWTVYVGAVVCTKRGTHVVVDALEEFAPKLVPVLKFIQYAIMLVYCWFVFRFSLLNLGKVAKNTSPNINIPMKYVYMIFPVTIALIAVFAIRHLIALFRHEKYGVVASEVEEALEAVKKEEAAK